MKARADLAGCACSLSVALSRSITEIQVGCLVKFFLSCLGGVKLVNGILKVSCDEFFYSSFFRQV